MRSCVAILRSSAAVALSSPAAQQTVRAVIVASSAAPAFATLMAALAEPDCRASGRLSADMPGLCAPHPEQDSGAWAAHPKYSSAAGESPDGAAQKRKRMPQRTVAQALMRRGAGKAPGAEAPRAPKGKRAGVSEPRLLPAGVTQLFGGSKAEAGGEVLLSPAAFAPAEAQRLLEQLQARRCQQASACKVCADCRLRPVSGWMLTAWRGWLHNVQSSTPADCMHKGCGMTVTRRQTLAG